MRKMTRITRKLRPKDENQCERRGNLFKRIIFVEVTAEIHKLVKLKAGERNITMRKWITRAIKKNLREEFSSE